FSLLMLFVTVFSEPPYTTKPRSTKVVQKTLKIKSGKSQVSKIMFASIPYSQSLQSRLGLELILIFCSRFLVIKFVRSPSWLTVPSNSRAEEIVARRPSDWPPLPPPRAPEPPMKNNPTLSYDARKYGHLLLSYFNIVKISTPSP
uniref:Uncharacterized protein n=1 Tax=Echeneis naucrates TaxID=173247 RepID=A0A665T7Z7_ECHNA